MSRLSIKETTAVPRRWLLLLLAGLLLPSLACSMLGTPKTFTVDTTADDPDVTVGDGRCATESGECSLRAAVAEAQAWDGAVTIKIPGDVYQPRESDGLLIERGRITLRGDGAGSTILDGGGAHRLFKITGGIITLRDLTIQNGRSSGDLAYGSGGGILIRGKNLVVTLRKVQLVDNKSAMRGGGLAILGDDGGLTAVSIQDSYIANNIITHSLAGVSGGAGIYIDDADLTILRTTIDNNVGGNGGGGVKADSGTRLRIYDSTFSRNQALYGGGLLVKDRLSLYRSTLSGNAARLQGGALLLLGSANVSVRNSTIVGNEATVDADVSSNTIPSGGGGIYLVSGSSLVMSNSIVALNTLTRVSKSSPVADDCRGMPTSEGHNLLGNDANCTFTPVTGDQVGSSSPLDPKLGALADNGGPTQTHLPLSGSPVIDQGSAGTPGSAPEHCFTTDQRGASVPQDGDGMDGARCDIGAVEKAP